MSHRSTPEKGASCSHSRMVLCSDSKSTPRPLSFRAEAWRILSLNLSQDRASGGVCSLV